jgi:hypothetical protein
VDAERFGRAVEALDGVRGKSHVEGAFGLGLRASRHIWYIYLDIWIGKRE